MKNKRKPIGEKLRFEVFKRDQFKCQYCGVAAPDVVLHIDHINPVSKGGDNEKTACYIRGILKNRISYVDYHKSVAWLLDALDSGVDEEYLKDLAKTVKNWTQFSSAMESILNG